MKGLFWGLLTIDLHFFTDHFPKENAKTKVNKFNLHIGGPATNAAITFQHLGGESLLITAIGENTSSDMIKQELMENAIKFHDLKANENTDPIYASILTNTTSASRTIFSYPPSTKDINHVNVDLKDIDIALFDGFYMDSTIEIASKCRMHGITTVMDGGSWKPKTEALLPFIDVAICSEDFTPPGTTDQTDVISYLLKNGVKKAAITRGAKPIIANEGEVNLLVEVSQAKVVDTLGAGDIFHGAFCYFYGKNNDFITSLEKASEIAARSCKFHGPRAWMEQENS